MIGIIDPAHVLVLLQAASALSGYSIPTDPPPQVVELKTYEMNLVTCRHHTPESVEPCEGAVGYYEDGDNPIYVDRQWQDSGKAQSSEDSTIVHELVHWLQYKHGFDGEYCPRTAAREQEAYRVENFYIKQYEHGTPVGVSLTICGYHIGE